MSIYKIGLILISLALFLQKTLAFSKQLKVGDMAPNFKMQDETGAWRTMDEFKKGKVVLYFYPKDNSPYCTKQACSLRDSKDIFAKKDIIVLGVSYGSVESHKAFKEKYKLPFILLSDSDKKASVSYGTKGIFMPDRVTFLINDGKIVSILKDINVAAHADQILKEFGIK